MGYKRIQGGGGWLVPLLLIVVVLARVIYIKADQSTINTSLGNNYISIYIKIAFKKRHCLEQKKKKVE